MYSPLSTIFLSIKLYHVTLFSYTNSLCIQWCNIGLHAPHLLLLYSVDTAGPPHNVLHSSSILIEAIHLCHCLLKKSMDFCMYVPHFRIEKACYTVYIFIHVEEKVINMNVTKGLHTDFQKSNTQHVMQLQNHVWWQMTGIRPVSAFKVGAYLLSRYTMNIVVCIWIHRLKNVSHTICRLEQMPTHNSSIFCIPIIMTNCSPHSLQAHLHSSFKSLVATSKSHFTISTLRWKKKDKSFIKL